jgi:RHS repeat-associated protein
MVTDINANEVQFIHYAPFGEILQEENVYWHQGKVPDFAFNGKELDEESGMYYFEARYMKPPTFIQRDPLFEAKPWMSGYAYCSNSPINRVDPSGMFDTKQEAKQYKKDNNIKGNIKQLDGVWRVMGNNGMSYYKQENGWNTGKDGVSAEAYVSAGKINPEGSQKQGFFDKAKAWFKRVFSGGVYGTSKQGQGQETREGDGQRIDLTPLIDHMPEPFQEKFQTNTQKFNFLTGKVEEKEESKTPSPEEVSRTGEIISIRKFGGSTIYNYSTFKRGDKEDSLEVINQIKRAGDRVVGTR